MLRSRTLYLFHYAQSQHAYTVPYVPEPTVHIYTMIPQRQGQTVSYLSLKVEAASRSVWLLEFMKDRKMVRFHNNGPTNTQLLPSQSVILYVPTFVSICVIRNTLFGDGTGRCGMAETWRWYTAACRRLICLETDNRIGCIEGNEANVCHSLVWWYRNCSRFRT